MRPLCHLSTLPIDTARSFAPLPGAFTGLFAVRTPTAIHVYINACPHIGAPLDRHPGHFLTPDRANILCSTHGARFDIPSGLCIQGPCQGDHLEPVKSNIENGWLLVPDDAGL